MSKADVIAKYSKSSGISKSTLSKVYSEGIGPIIQWSRNVSAMLGLLVEFSFATGKGGARKADKDLLRSKRKKGLVS